MPKMLRTREDGRMRSVSELSSQVKHSNQGCYIHREYFRHGLSQALGRVFRFHGHVRSTGAGEVRVQSRRGSFRIEVLFTVLPHQPECPSCSRFPRRSLCVEPSKARRKGKAPWTKATATNIMAQPSATFAPNMKAMSPCVDMPVSTTPMNASANFQRVSSFQLWEEVHSAVPGAHTGPNLLHGMAQHLNVWPKEATHRVTHQQERRSIGEFPRASSRTKRDRSALGTSNFFVRRRKAPLSTCGSTDHSEASPSLEYTWKCSRVRPSRRPLRKPPCSRTVLRCLY